MIPSSFSDPRPAPAGTLDRELELARLRARLQRLAARHAAERPPPADPLPLESVPTPHGSALRRVEMVRVPSAIAAAAPPSPGTVFLDTETTGLSGGTGTYVFLVGLATWTAPRTITVTQYFLGDLGAEAAFLHAVREAVAEARALVTFNGRTFDLPLLETRYLLSRAGWWGEDLPHPSLPVARALWRAAPPLPSRPRGALPGSIGDDLPGALVPQVYFRYLRRAIPARSRGSSGTTAGTRGATRASTRGRRAARRPGSAPRSRQWMGAGRWLERRAPDRSARLRLAGLPDGLEPGVAWRLGWLWRRAADSDARTSGRRRWRAPRPPLRLLIDLAKLHEHHGRDYGAALDLTRAALGIAEAWDLAERGLVEALERRAHRLTQRLARAMAPAAAPAPPG
jgi:hypothetical protein